ncbi:MAG: helix-turn-helix domain-containing protein [Candidatus Omnitrophica bacterium]|nr:helix-turn-helix domain-containing protein [Candidatus Omnitrophota bacterium]
MTEKWLTIDQIADYLQASKEKVYKLCQRGKMPASKFGGQWRFDKNEIDQWLRMQRPQKTKKTKNG